MAQTAVQTADKNVATTRRAGLKIPREERRYKKKSAGDWRCKNTLPARNGKVQALKNGWAMAIRHRFREKRLDTKRHCQDFKQGTAR